MPRRYTFVALLFFITDRMRRDARESPPPATPLTMAEKKPAEREPGEPVAVMAAIGNRQIIVARSREAKFKGVRVGMTVTEARAICPDLDVRPRAVPDDERELRRLAEWAIRWGPHTGIVPPPPDQMHHPFGIWIDVTGCDRVFGGEVPLAKDIFDAFTNDGFAVRVGIAGTLLAARAVALFGPNERAIVPARAMGAFLNPLPVAALPFAAGTLEQFEILALDSIGAVMALDRAAIASRFGEAALRLLDEAFGQRPEILRPASFAAPIRVLMPLDGPTDRQDALVFLTRRLCTALTAHLSELGLGARRIELLLDRGSAREPAISLTLRLTTPQRDSQYIFELLRERLERIDLSFPIDSLQITAMDTDRLTPHPHPIFDSPETTNAFGPLLDRLRDRLGDAAVGYWELVESHIPERSCRLRPAIEVHATTANAATIIGAAKRPRAAKSAPPALPAFPRPAMLFEPAIEVFIQQVGKYETFSYDRTRYHIAFRTGPERIATDWWTGEWVARDYFVIHTHEGPLFWLFFTPHSRQWFLHGLFD